LGLDNVGVINETCRILGIERLTPDNTDLEDAAVWKSIRDDTTLVFQWESDSAQAYLKRFMSDNTIQAASERVENFSLLKWMSFGNGLIRPACASFRNSVADGEFYDNGFEELNSFLALESGRIAMQETIMQFLVEFCGYSNAESDNVRRAIAKKKGTETLLPEIKERFISHSSERYSITKEHCESVIEPFIQVILDASAYAFSWNHSDSYSAIGYICGYLRYYHPLEFLTSALNIFGDNTEKTAAITKYATKIGIKVTLPKWGLSRSDYFFDKEKNVIAKGLSSIKYMSSALADELYQLSKNRRYTYFMDLLYDIDRLTSVNSRQLEILVRLDFFSDFGNQRELLRMIDLFNLFKKGQAKQIKKAEIDGTPLEEIVKKYAVGVTKSGGVAKSYTLLDVMAILRDTEDAVVDSNMEDLSDLVKVRNFYDVMGYIGYISGKEEDRRKLYITDVRPVSRKSDGKRFGYGIFTKSIGSGKESRFTVFNSVYDKEPLKEGDIIYCKEYIKDGQYYRLTAYSKIF
jgi:DNA polymerase III, alpha subunit